MTHLNIRCDFVGDCSLSARNHNVSALRLLGKSRHIIALSSEAAMAVNL